MLVGKKVLGTVAYMGGVPAVLEEFCWSWGQMIQWNQEALADDTHIVHYDRVKFSDHGPARNALVQRFLGDWLFMLDCDHQFEPDILCRLLKIMREINCEVLTGLYQMKVPPYPPLLYQDIQGYKIMGKWDSDATALQIASAGAGCLLVKKTVYDRIRIELGVGPFDRLQNFSEDHSFFNYCARLKIPAYAAMKVEANHLRTVPVTLADHQVQAAALAEPISVGGFQ